jgi:hypothetical protein
VLDFVALVASVVHVAVLQVVPEVLALVVLRFRGA